MNNNRRRADGDETWYRLLSWTKGQKSSERLSALLLSSENFNAIDPSHPLGGRDNLKDVVCIKNKIKYIVGCYFIEINKDLIKLRLNSLLKLKVL